MLQFLCSVAAHRASALAAQPACCLLHSQSPPWHCGDSWCMLHIPLHVWQLVLLPAGPKAPACVHLKLHSCNNTHAQGRKYMHCGSSATRPCYSTLVGYSTSCYTGQTSLYSRVCTPAAAYATPTPEWCGLLPPCTPLPCTGHSFTTASLQQQGDLTNQNDAAHMCSQIWIAQPFPMKALWGRHRQAEARQAQAVL